MIPYQDALPILRLPWRQMALATTAKQTNYANGATTLMSEELRAAAEAYHELGVSVVPFKLTKTATGEYDKQNLSPWKKWETEPQTDQEFKTLNWCEANAFAVVLGTQAKNGYYLAVIDYDVKGAKTNNESKTKGREILREFPITQTHETINKGIHLVYWSRTKPRTDGTLHNIAALELLGEKKLCLMPPSLGYKNLNDNTPSEIQSLEETFYSIMKTQGLLRQETEANTQPIHRRTYQSKIRPCIIEALKGQLTGPVGHLMRLTIAGEYKRLGSTDQDIIPLFKDQGDFNFETCRAQVSSADPNKTASCRTILQWGYCLPNCSIKQERDGESQADRAVKLCLEKNVEFFHDQHRTPYARVILTFDAIDAINGISASNTDATITYKAIYRLRDVEFKTYVSHLMYESEQKVIGSEALSAALNVLHFKSISNQQKTMYNRVAPDPRSDGSIWLDMGDERRRAYHITKDGWTLEVDVPILFRRYEHQKALPEAVRGGDPWKILNYINLGKTVSEAETVSKASIASEKKKLLLMVQNISALIPDMPHPISAIYGCPGTFKSSSQAFIRGIIDPSSVSLLGMPRDLTALVQNLEHHYMPVFDNLSYMPHWMSDCLCRAVTGEGQEVRQLYTDDGVVIREFKRCPMINGLNIPAQTGDLLNRTIMHETVPMPEKRRTMEDLTAQYEKEKAEILGGYLDTIVKALQLFPDIKGPKLFRLADFSKWGCAITQALGRDQDIFIAAYEANIESQNEEITNASLVAKAFIGYCEKKLNKPRENDPHKTTPEELFRAIESMAVELNINTRNKSWPKAAHAFSRKLNETRDAIAALGWYYEIFPSGKTREFQIWTTEPDNPKKDPPQDRFCSNECNNFRKPGCAVAGSNAMFRPEDAEVPLKCSGFEPTHEMEER